ncbi:MAG: hypothetical protein SGJ26_17880 [Nitrospirota bacterium]|nr:hypothetical protein [Nitrospirota bacterium]
MPGSSQKLARIGKAKVIKSGGKCMGSELQSDGCNILHEWLKTGSQDINVAVWSWSYKVSVSKTPWVVFDWEGTAITTAKQKVSVIGEFIIMNDFLLEDWSGHPFEDGEVRLIERSSLGADAFISMDLRINGECSNEIWKAFVMGLCVPGKGGVTINVKLKSPTPDDWEKIQDVERYKKRDCIAAIRGFSVHSGGSLEEAN